MVIPLHLRSSRAIVVELALAATVLVAAYVGVIAAHFPTQRSNPVETFAAASVFALIQLAMIAVFGLLRHDIKQSAIGFAGRFSLSLLLGAGVCHLAVAAMPDQNYYRNSIADAVLLGAGGLLVLRLLLAMTGLRSELFAHRVLVIGTGPDALMVENMLSASATAGVAFVGFYPMGDTTHAVVDPERVLSNAHSLEDLVVRLRVREVIVAIREQRGGALSLNALVNCRLRGTRVTDLSCFFERTAGEVPVDSLKASWVIYGDGFRQDWARQTVKRAFDIVASTILLVITAPIMIAAAAAIYLESGRPIIFRQDRVGLAGRSFPLLKFRSMRKDAEKDGVPRWAMKGDPRVTPLGRFMRRCRIDELPQIFNVLRGEMSFVGPRPERPFFVSQLSERIPFYWVRHSVKPGLTGWAQVSYKYGASIEDAIKKLQFDLYYVKNHVLLLDLVILFKTIKVVLRGEGAR